MLVAVTDHAAERFRQRIGGRAGEAGRVSDEPPPGASGSRGSVYVRDLVDRSLVFVCRRDAAARELVVVTLWEVEGGVAPPRVPRRFTDALRRGARDSSG